MKTILKIFSLNILLFGLIFAQDVGRYVDSEFEVDTVAIDVVYGTAPALTSPYQSENSTYNYSLKMNIYQPKNDTLSLRPVLIVAHGGGFIKGEKEHDDMLAFCDTFARKGYVTATIQYRQGMNPASEISAARAVYRGLQDARAVIRFIREKAADYNIDTNRVYFLGSSAGAFMGLHNLYMNEESERPPYSYKTTDNTFPYTDAGPDLGGLDAAGNDYVHNAHPNAVISLWGALADTALVKSGDPDSPVLLVHGTADDYVYFNVGKPFGLTTLPATYGSNPVSQKLSNMGIDFETYFVQGVGHEFYGVTNGEWNDDGPNAYWDTVVTKVTGFLYKQHKPTADFSYYIDDKHVTFTYSGDGTKTYWDFGDGNSVGNAPNAEHDYEDYGTYRVKLTVFNEIGSWDTLSQTIDVKNPVVTDSLALIALYDSTDGDNWTNNTNWKSSEPMSTWYGIVIVSGRVFMIDLSNNNLKGKIPAEIGNLSALQHLRLPRNQLSGRIPKETGNLVKLVDLYLNENNLIGEIPAELGKLKNLRELWLERNQLSGNIPEELGGLISLRNMVLHTNQLSGTIPNSFCELTSLQNLNLISNKFSGVLPDSLIKLKNLMDVAIEHNDFTDIPDFSSLNNFRSLIVDDNKLTFEDLEPNMGINYFTYIPQDSVGETIDTTISEGSSYTLTVKVGGDSNIYQWYHGYAPIEGADSCVYKIDSVSAAASGNYTCYVTNSVVPGLTIYSRPITIHVEPATGIDNSKSAIPIKYSLQQNYPNPFNPSTMINYGLPEAAKVKISVYDILGRRVALLLDEQQSAGYHSIKFDASAFSAGIYFYAIKTKNFYQIKKMILIK